MLYFIPAWYQQNKWCENEQNWHVRRMHTEFDDTVKQIQLFHRSGVFPYQIMLLGFSPNFRHFLHRQGVYHAPYWSCFDAIQCVRRRRPMVLSFHNLNWPDDIEFLYTSFVVIAMQNGQKYAQIEFGEDGNPIQIDMYREEKIVRRNFYDDRGFVASTVLFEEGKPVYQDYLTESGVWKLRCYEKDGHVEINPKQPEYLLICQGRERNRKFQKTVYDDISQVIAEVLTAYLKLTKESDLFCVAMHERHAKLLGEALEGRKMILSFFSERYAVETHPEVSAMIRRADYIIADSRRNRERIRWNVGVMLSNIIDITPYDSRVDFGISQQMNVQKILVPVDGMDNQMFEQLIRILGEYLAVNEDARIHLFTRDAEFDRCQKLLSQTRDCLRRFGVEEGWAAEKETGMAENRLEEAAEVPVRFFVEQCVDELAVSVCMREQRLIVDVRRVSELYLQISAISMGIPQILCTQTEFVEHGRNGMILKDLDELPDALAYYLEGLTNWNEAMVCAYEIGKKYTSERLTESWKEVIESIG